MGDPRSPVGGGSRIWLYRAAHGNSGTQAPSDWYSTRECVPTSQTYEQRPNPVPKPRTNRPNQDLRLAREERGCSDRRIGGGFDDRVPVAQPDNEDADGEDEQSKLE